MKRFLIVLSLLWATSASAQFTTTSNYGFKKPNSGLANSWDAYLNGDFDLLDTLLGGGATTAAATYNVGDLACVTATNTVGSCGSAAANLTFIGVLLAKNGTRPVWTALGVTLVNSNASASFVAGDIVCSDPSNGGKVIDNGALPCGGSTTEVGVSIVSDGNVTSHAIVMSQGTTGGSTGALPTMSASTTGQRLVNTGSVAAWSAPTLDCTQFAGADMSVKIQACTSALNSLSTLHGVADARGFVGNQTWSVCPLGGTHPKGGRLLLGGAAITRNVPCALPRNWTQEGASGGNAVPGQNGTSFSANAATFQATYNTGTVTVTGTAVTGSGTTWTSAMQNCMLAAGNSITTGATAWGNIATVGSATSITLALNGGSNVVAGTAYAIYCPMDTMGSGIDGNNEQAIGISYIDYNCNAIAGAIGIANYFAEEGAYVDHVGIRNCDNIGLDIESQFAQNSGPYTNIGVGSVACPSSFMAIVIRINSSSIRSLRGGTIGCSGQAVAIDLEAYQTRIEDIQLTGGTKGIEVGGNIACAVACVSAGFDARNSQITNISGGNPGGTTMIDLSTTHPPGGMVISGINAVSGWTNTLVDNNNSCTTATNPVGIYVLSRTAAGPIAYSDLTTAGCYAAESVASISTPSHLLVSSTAPTITTHFNTSGDSISANNGTASFTVTVGTGTGTSTGVLGLPTATTGWNCSATNRTRAALVLQSASTTASATLTNFGTTFAATNWTNSDVLQVSCLAY